MGNVIKKYDYDPFGREEVESLHGFGENIATELWMEEVEEIDNPFRYCGEYLDFETNNI